MGLNFENKLRYLEKIALIGGTDPYSVPINDWKLNLNQLPRITHAHITDFLIFRLDSKSQKEIKAFKSLNAWIQFASKWIQSLRAKEINNVFVIIGKVLHSQRVSAAPVISWIFLSGESEILASHCNCAAGLGEACTHIAALLFALEFAGKEKKSVTDVLAYWIGPRSKESFYKKIRDIDFSLSLNKDHQQLNVNNSKQHIVPEMNKKEVEEFLKMYKSEGCVSALHPFFSTTSTKSLPQPLTTLFDKTYIGRTIEELQVVAEVVINEIKISVEESKMIEEKTRLQSRSTDWFLMRAGRLTASRFKAACRTNIDKPSITLINSICYPHIFKTTFKAGQYGCRHESDAIQCFINHHQRQHPKSNVVKCGLFINAEFPFFAATPDAILNCDTCGTGCIEVKCPICAVDTSIEELINIKKTYIVLGHDEQWMLDENHAYFYQVHMQMAVTNTEFCYFVVWSPQDFFQEKIIFNRTFWEQQSMLAINFYKKVVIPELLSKYFSTKTPQSRKTQAESSTIFTTCSEAEQSNEELQVWCYCGKPDFGEEMIRCQNKNCRLQFFHYTCVNLKKIPKKWMCLFCKKT